MESLEAGLEFEMANLERDLSLLKILQGLDEERNENGQRRIKLVREIGRHGELFRRLRKDPPRARKHYPRYSAERRKFEKLITPPSRRKFYAERTGSIFKIPSLSSSEDELSSEDSCHETLSKGSPPKVLSHLHNLCIQAGCRIKLSCSIDGDPCPEVSWFHNGKPLALKNRHFIVSMVRFSRVRSK